MLSTTLATSQMTIPKITTDGLNWIVWKAHIQILIGVKKLAHLLDDSAVVPAKLDPLATGVKDAEVTKHEAASKKYQEHQQSDTKVKHLIASTILDTLLIKTINCMLSEMDWAGIKPATICTLGWMLYH